MNEEVAKEVVRWMQGLGDTVAGQAPLLADEIVRWTLIGGVAYGFVALAASVGLGVLCVYSYRRYYHFKKIYNESMDAKVYLPAQNDALLSAMAGFISGALSIMLVFASFVNFATALKAYTAPRLVVIERLK